VLGDLAIAAIARGHPIQRRREHLWNILLAHGLARLALAPPVPEMGRRVEEFAVDGPRDGIQRLVPHLHFVETLLQVRMRAPAVALREVDPEERRLAFDAVAARPREPVPDMRRPAVGADLEEDQLVDEVAVSFPHVPLDEFALIADGAALPRRLVRIGREVGEPRPFHRKRPVEAHESWPVPFVLHAPHPAIRKIPTDRLSRGRSSILRR